MLPAVVSIALVVGSEVVNVDRIESLMASHCLSMLLFWPGSAVCFCLVSVVMLWLLLLLFGIVLVLLRLLMLFGSCVCICLFCAAAVVDGHSPL